MKISYIALEHRKILLNFNTAVEEFHIIILFCKTHCLVSDLFTSGLYWVATRGATHFPQWAVFFVKNTIVFSKK